jgi:[calcium/calmodulin-dependent protein kinase] kinase
VPNADSLFLVLEYQPGGVLMNVDVGADDSEARSPFTGIQVREYFRQVCLGLEYLHANGIAHRDVSFACYADTNFISPTLTCVSDQAG